MGTVSRVLALVGIVVLVTWPPAGPQRALSASSVGPKTYYLALGDSLAFGAQPTNQFYNGYADDLYAYLTQLGTRTLVNMGCIGETSSTFVYGGCPVREELKDLYTEPQLSAALSFLSSHPGQVSPVTLDMGTNDVSLLFDPATCVMKPTTDITRALHVFDANMSAALGQLELALHGTGDLLLMTNYFAYQNKCPNVLPLAEEFNAHLVTDAQRYGVPVAPVFSAFGGPSVPNPNLCAYTWMCSPSPDIHGTTQGYCVVATTLETTAGYAPPGPCGSLSGTFTGAISRVGASSSYAVTVGASGTAAFVTCATENFNDTYDLYVVDGSGTTLARGTSRSACNWVSANVVAGQTYTVMTVAISGTGQYRSAWSVNGAPVVWSVNGALLSSGQSESLGFPTLTAAPIVLASCGPSGSTFTLFLTDAQNTLLAASTASSNCQVLSYQPSAPGLFHFVEVAASGTGAWLGTINADNAATAPPPTSTPTPTSTPLPTSTATPTDTPTSTPTVAASIVLSQSSAKYGQTITITGTAFGAAEPVGIYWDRLGTTPLTSTTTDASGSFVTAITVPEAVYGRHAILAASRSARAGAFLQIQPFLILRPSSGAPGATVLCAGFGFGANEQVALHWSGPSQWLGTGQSNGLGTFDNDNAAAVMVPSDATSGVHAIVGVGSTTNAVGTAAFTVH